MKAMILAAGRGERLRPLTNKIPKPLLSVNGSTLIEHLLMQLKEKGLEEVVINVFYLAEQIKEKLGNGSKYGLSIQYSDETQTGSLGTGGGIYHALPLLGKDPFLVVSADIWANFPFAELINKLQKKDLAHLVLVQNPIENPNGDFGLDNDRVRLKADDKLTYSNVGILRPEIFDFCSERGAFSFRAIIEPAIKLGRVSGETYQGLWYNVGTPEQLQAIGNLK